MSETFSVATIDIAIIISIIASVISGLSLFISIFTAWLTYFNRGKIYMTMPSMIIFAYDRQAQNKFSPKVMIRSFIFSTGERGQVIETLFARLRHHGTEELFPIWGVNTDDKPVAGGGLWVGKTGLTAWQIFNSETKFQFMPGVYAIDIFAKAHGSKKKLELWSASFLFPEECAMQKHDGYEQIWFQLNPQSNKYIAKLEAKQRFSPSISIG